MVLFGREEGWGAEAGADCCDASASGVPVSDKDMTNGSTIKQSRRNKRSFSRHYGDGRKEVVDGGRHCRGLGPESLGKSVPTVGCAFSFLPISSFNINMIHCHSMSI